MHEQIVGLGDVVRLARHADVALLKVVALVFGRDHDPEPDVELALANQERFLDILLQDKDIGLHGTHGRRLGLNCLASRCWFLWCRHSGLGSLWLSYCAILGRSIIDCDIVRMGKVLELLGLGTRCMLHNEAFELFNSVKEVDSTASIGISWLEKPHVVAIVE